MSQMNTLKGSCFTLASKCYIWDRDFWLESSIPGSFLVWMSLFAYLQRCLFGLGFHELCTNSMELSWFLNSLDRNFKHPITPRHVFWVQVCSIQSSYSSLYDLSFKLQYWIWSLQKTAQGSKGVWNELRAKSWIQKSKSNCTVHRQTSPKSDEVS